MNGREDGAQGRGLSPWELADSLVDMLNEVTAERDRLREEIEHLIRALRLSEAKVGGAARYVDQANARSNMLENAMTAYEGIADERDRYRLAWLSARRRAARESEFAAEALALKDAEISRLVADVTRAEAFVAEVQHVRGWTMCAETPRDLLESHLHPIYDALYELEGADREHRPFRSRIERLWPFGK